MPERILIIGAGEAGEMVVKEILNHPELDYEIVGLVDDDPHKQGRLIFGKEVLGRGDDIPRIVNEYGVGKIIIAIPSARGSVIRNFVSRCEKVRVKFKIVPGVYEIISGSVSLSQIRPVRPEDLLGRETVRINMSEIKPYLEGRRVLVTGAAGSIGCELCKQLAEFDLTSLTMLDRDENRLFYMDMEMRKIKPSFPYNSLIGDIRDQDRIKEVFEEEKPDIVFHAAAHKHVPMMEKNPGEAVKNNIFGTKNLMDAACGSDCEKFILISTDKAVNPINVMGATKRYAELMMQLYEDNSCVFLAVRFGNVLGSEGSVVPLFKRQIEEGGPVTVTHPDAERYFMTVREAVQLIIQTLSIGRGGEVFVLEMGDPIKIKDLARDLITLSGLEPELDIKIDYTGLRSGEKLKEELLTQDEGVTATSYKKIYIAKPEGIDKNRLKRNLDELKVLTTGSEKGLLLAKLKEIVPSFSYRL